MNNKNKQAFPLKRYSFFQRSQKQKQLYSCSRSKSPSDHSLIMDQKDKSQLLPYLNKISQIIKSTDYLKKERQLQPKLKLRSKTTSLKKQRIHNKERNANWMSMSGQEKIQFLKVKMRQIKTPQNNMHLNSLPITSTIQSIQSAKYIQNQLPKLSKLAKIEIKKSKLIRLKNKNKKKVNKNSLQEVQDEIMRKNKLNFLKTSLADVFRSIRDDILHQKR